MEISALENGAPRGQEKCSRRAVVFLQVTASGAANDKPNFWWFLRWLQTRSAEVCDSSLVGKEGCSKAPLPPTPSLSPALPAPHLPGVIQQPEG